MEEQPSTHSYSFSWCECGHLVMGPEDEVLQPRRVPAKELKNGGYVQLVIQIDQRHGHDLSQLCVEPQI